VITINLINRTAQRIFKNINKMESFLEKNKLILPLDEYGLLINLRDDLKFFLVFLESTVRESKVDNLKFEKDLKPILIICEDVEDLLLD
jgi:hypothetical protein